MNWMETLAQEMKRVSAMTRPELEAAYGEDKDRTVSELTALALARKAADGGMDAIKLMRELSREEPEENAGVEIRVIGPADKGDG